MRPIGKLPVTFALGEQKHVDDLHIYHDVKGVLLSWRAAKGLHILPEDYPQPSNPTPVQLCTTRVHTATSQDIMKEFPSVFDGRIKTMEGENFHISLRSNAKPFCVKTPRSIQGQAQIRVRPTARARNHRPYHRAYRVVRPYRHYTQERFRQYPNVRRSLSFEQIRQTRTISIGNTGPSCSRHRRRQRKNFYASVYQRQFQMAILPQHQLNPY